VVRSGKEERRARIVIDRPPTPQRPRRKIDRDHHRSNKDELLES
jgi:hypothetical protein